MKQTIFRLILVGSLALPYGAVAAGSPADLKPHDTMSEQTSDAHREIQILTAFSRNPHLHAFDFSVSVDVDRVVLGGTVDDDVNRSLAEKIAIDVDGIKYVVNHIVVDADYMRFHQTPTELAHGRE